MKHYSVFLLAVLLTACGGQEEAPKAAEAAQTPKPVFTVKHIDDTVIQGLSLGAATEDKTPDGKKRLIYPIGGLAAGNVVELIGDHPADLETVSGKCMESDGAGQGSGWSKEGTCYALFSKMAANVAANSTELTDYLLSHAGLQPYQAGKGGYAAVQNGRYILEVDSDGLFFFRRRHY